MNWLIGTWVAKLGKKLFLGLARERSLSVNPGEQPWCAVDAARNRREKTPTSPSTAVLTGWKGKEASYRFFFLAGNEMFSYDFNRER